VTSFAALPVRWEARPGTKKSNLRPIDSQSATDRRYYQREREYTGTRKIQRHPATAGQSSQYPQRQLGDCSGPTYQESPFNLCARSAQRNQAKTSRRRLVGRLYMEHHSILRRAARDGTKGPDVCRQDLKYPPTAVGGIRSKQCRPQAEQALGADSP